MGNMTNKEDLLNLLKKGAIEEFNESRAYDEKAFLDLTEIDLKDVVLSGANFEKTDLSGSDFSESELNNVNFSGSDLSAVNFAHTNIESSCFNDTVLEGTIFTKSVVSCCDFTGAEFTGANICYTDLTGSDLSLCENLMLTSYDKNTVWPADECLPDDFDPEYDHSFAELEDDDMEDQYSF